MRVRSVARDHRPDLSEFAQHVAESLARGGRLRLEIGDEAYELAGDSAEAITVVLHGLAQGHTVDITALPDELTTGQAADLLGVSRPTVVKLVDTGAIPSTRVGTHRRVRTTDVLAYRERVRSDRSAALDELTELSQELGLYDQR